MYRSLSLLHTQGSLIFYSGLYSKDIILRGMVRMTPSERFEQNQKLVYSVLNKYYPHRVQDEDIVQTGFLGLWRACLKFDESRKSYFSTFAYVCILNEVRMYLRYERKLNLSNIISLETPLCEVEGEETLLLEDTLQDPESSSKFDFVDLLISLEQTLPSQQVEFILAHMDRTSSEVARDVLHISRQAVCNKRHRIQQKLSDAKIITDNM